ncbi:putative pectate lyase A [Venustampulla echinocandica]|uniref:pectate lyase n=1 Tax=Venustampulla echinocandica TaxID=2656787 RepID=A0A370TXN0_9HELO|nr:putative pectate lyase A [Venustampulla echinocandica]RDL40281.1 putative pectate lyase A [Venustampulla echinocandica]
MKLNAILSSGLMAAVALAAPTPTIDEPNASFNKRASVTETPGGYASQNGGTTGGAGGTTTTVSSFAQFTAAVAGDAKKVVFVSAPITSSVKQVKIGSNTSVIGKSSKVVFTGFGVLVKDAKNVIIRNIGIANVVAANGDALGIQKSTNVWVDHVDLSSDRDHDKDFYDGLLDATHAADFITITNSKIHDHWKASLVGHSDSNKAEDTGKLRITYANNHWLNINSRGPSFRFGTGHMFNNYYENVSDGINTRSGAQVLVENNIWAGKSSKALYTVNDGGAVASGNDFGPSENTAPAGTLKTVPYKYTLVAASAVKAAVVGKAGNTLTF